MSLYLVDTNICIFLLNQRAGYERIVQRMDGLERAPIGLSAITVAELEFGVAASQRQGDNFSRLERFLLEFEVLPFDRDAARPYGSLRKSLQAQGTPIGPLDFLIAAHALALKATLVTNNTREFQRVSVFVLKIGQAQAEMTGLS
ncbi:MAG: type II toxin-antitoxin system tRNA(fMet)-specific endonuclease VapC [Methylobacter sp.]